MRMKVRRRQGQKQGSEQVIMMRYDARWNESPGLNGSSTRFTVDPRTRSTGRVATRFHECPSTRFAGRWAALFALGCLVAASSGCSPVGMATTGVQIVRGVQSRVIPLEGAAPAAFEPYNSVRLGEVTTDVPPICTPEVLAAVRKSIPEALGREAMTAFPGGSPALVLDVTCRFYKRRSIIGAEGRLDLAVVFRDAETGEQVGRIYVEGLTQSPLHTGLDDMARGVARELARFLRDRKQGRI